MTLTKTLELTVWGQSFTLFDFMITSHPKRTVIKSTEISGNCFALNTQ